jgi:hypothetical protein
MTNCHHVRKFGHQREKQPQPPHSSPSFMMNKNSSLCGNPEHIPAYSTSQCLKSGASKISYSSE